MDPVTQGALGAAFAQTRGRPRELAKAAVLGGLSGMAADLDILIRSPTDPLLFLEYHRQFTHSLAFIPVGGLICALFFYLLLGKRWQLGFSQLLVWCTIGYATHGLLDGCTSYGTLLMWPFSDFRYAWDIISIIDPLFTLPLLVLVILTAVKQSRYFLLAALLWGAGYLSLGYLQQQRAITIGEQLAASRGHQPLLLEAKPSFANLLVWKVIYQTPERFYVDAVRPGWFGEDQVFIGDSIARLDVQRDFPWLDPVSQQAADIERFRWFSVDYLAVDPRRPDSIMDIRYSLLPNEINSLWGISLQRNAPAEQHVSYYTRRDEPRAAMSRLWQMITP